MDELKIIKILVIGDNKTGKTSLINKIIFGTYDETYEETIDISFLTKIYKLSQNNYVKIELWDIPTSKIYNDEGVYFDIHGIFFIADMVNKESIDKILDIKKKLMATFNINVPSIFVLNKYDLIKPAKIKKKLMEKICSDYGFNDNIVISVKDNHNVATLVKLLLNKILRYDSKNNIFTDIELYDINKFSNNNDSDTNVDEKDIKLLLPKNNDEKECACTIS